MESGQFLPGQIQALLRAQRAVASSLDLTEVLRTIVSEAAAITGASAVRLLLLDEAGEILRFGAGIGLPEDVQEGIAIPVGESFSGEAVRTGRPVAVADVRSDPRVIYRAHVTDHGLVSHLGLPVKAHESVVGVLVFNSRDVREYTEEEIAFLSAFAEQAGTAIHNARLHEALQQGARAGERALEDLRNHEAFVHAVLNSLTDHIAVLDAAGRIVTTNEAWERFARENGDPVMEQVGVGADYLAVVRRAAAEGDEVARDALAGIQAVLEGSRAAFQLEYPCHSPTVRRWFLLHATPLTRPRPGAVVSHLNITARKQAEEQLATRTGQLEAVRLVTSEIARELHLSELLDLILRRAMEMVEAVSGTVFLWDAAAQVLVREAWHGFGPWRGETRLRLGEAVAGRAAQRREGLIVNDFRTSPYARPVTIERTTISAVLGVPLLYREQLVGAITLDRHGAAQPFTEEHLTVLTLFAVHAAIAIENARAHDEARRLARQLATLTRLTQSLAAATRAETVGQEVMAAVRALMPEAAARLWDVTGDDLATLTLIASVGLQDARGGTVRFRKGEGLAGVAASSRRTVVSRDLLQDPRFVNKGWAEQEKLVSALLSPLVVSDKVRGILTVFTRKPYEFSESETALFESLSAHAAIALENAALHEGAVRRGDEMEALLRAARSLMAGLDLKQVLDRIAAEAARIANTPHVKILLVEEATQGLRVALAQGETAQPDFPSPLGPSLSGTVAATGQPLFVADSQDQSENPNAAFDRQQGLRTYLGLPVKIRDEVLGVLTFNTAEPKEYSADEIAYLGSFANQAALAIENARLYERVRQQAAELEARVRARTAELERALRAKGEFLTRMSHEFRTPLNFVLGFADLLQRESAGALTPTQVRYADRIRTGGQRLLDLVNNLLELTALEGEQGCLRLETVSLAEMAGEAIGFLDVQIAAKALAVKAGIPPEFRVVVDRSKVAQVLRYLLSNAVKFTPAKGTVTIAARMVEEGVARQTGRAPAPEAAAHPSVEIVVEDTGIGILPENVERIFRVFEQADDSPARAYVGAGLGLTLVRALVERHGGTVWAESAGSGKGARFVVRLPRLESPSAKRILIVEDAPATLRLTSAMLRDAGYAVEGAGTAGAAAAALARGAVDLLLLDLGLPDRPGLEILRELRAAAPTQSLPVLVLTGQGEVKRDEALELGADEYLTTPTSPTILLRVVEELLRRGRGYRRGTEVGRDGFFEVPST